MKMREDARWLVGTHDFTSFKDSECCSKTPVKTIYAISVERASDVIEIRVVGSGFLKQMVRNIVGTLVDLNRNRLHGRSMSDILQARNRRLAGVTAPAHGLCMDWIAYDGPPVTS
jgi:tRNA pseudouridine38-40 synthase